jgi:hypothetical protein
MQIPKFSPKELNVVAEIPSVLGGVTPIYDFPVSCREGCVALFRRRPVWQVMLGLGPETVTFTPGCNPDNVARAFVYDGTFVPGKSNLTGGKDMFGIEWEYVPSAGGSMVRPGKPFLGDANEWYDKLVWPDIDSWDWEGCGKANEHYLKPDRFNFSMLLNGWFERLISFMDFERAVVAMIDEDQKQAVKELFDKLTDLYIRIVDKYLTCFPMIDAIGFHDDWGSQKETFFSPETVGEMIVPYMRRITDHLHARGRFCDLHSCGQLMKQVPNMIAAGWDSWNPQAMNDTHKIYELYGDKILIAVLPEPYDAENSSESEQRARARAYADQFCRPDRPSTLNMYAAYGQQNLLTQAFLEELYKQSRINYSK